LYDHWTAQEERMKKARIEAFPRGERPDPAALGPVDVKNFLDNGDERLYPPRFIPEGPTPRG
jgi:hypothetical protein